MEVTHLTQFLPLESDGFNHALKTAAWLRFDKVIFDFLGIEEGESKENHAAWWDISWLHWLLTAKLGSPRGGATGRINMEQDHEMTVR